jgi:hypothetical protein
MMRPRYHAIVLYQIHAAAGLDCLLRKAESDWIASLVLPHAAYTIGGDVFALDAEQITTP